MPIYEYECGGCSAITEQMQRVTDPPLAACPKCGGAVSRLVSRSSFQLKGAGWYVTDYKKKGTEGATAEAKPVPAAPKTCGSGGCGSGGGTTGD